MILEIYPWAPFNDEGFYYSRANKLGMNKIQ